MVDDTMEKENQDLPPPLDPSLAPALLFKLAAGDETTDNDNDDDDDGTRFLYSISKRRLVAVAGLDYLLNGDAATWNTPQGWVLILDPSTHDASLRDPFTSRTVRLPPPDGDLHLPNSNQHTRCLLSSSTDGDDDPGRCIVLLVHLEDPVLWYCSLGGSRWFRHEYPSELFVVNDQNTINGVMGSLIAARGKFYTLVFGDSLYNKIMELEFSPGPIFSITRVTCMPPRSRFFRTNLVESCGDLFFLRISLEYFCAQAITEIYVCKLVLSNNSWVTVKVAALGDNRVFFSGSCGDDSYVFGASMAAGEVGLKANCIYFTHNADKELYVHDLERGTTTLHSPGTVVPDSAKPILLMHANAIL